MNKISQIAALLITLTFIICTAEAKAQAFLNPVSSQAPSFLENNAIASAEAVASTGATGNQNNSDNLLTTQGAYNAGVVGGRYLNVQSAQEGLLAPNSVNNSAFPSGSYSYGFTGTNTKPYAGQTLPLCSTGSVDLNIVNCPNLLTNYGPTQYNPWGVSTMLVNPTNPTLPLDLQETASEAAIFVQAAANISGN
jgi:hypothetical protein